MVNAVFWRHIIKSGNSFTVVIPAEIYEGLGLYIRQSVQIKPNEDGTILLIPERKSEHTFRSELIRPGGIAHFAAEKERTHMPTKGDEK